MSENTSCLDNVPGMPGGFIGMGIELMKAQTDCLPGLLRDPDLRFHLDNQEIQHEEDNQ